MDKQPVGQLPDLAQSNNDDEIMVITNSEYNQLKKEKISDLITDFTSTNENNALTKGTDGKMFVTDFGNASNITEGTLPVSVLPDIPKDLLPAIETSDLPVSGVTADTYAYPSSVTVNAQGMVTAIEEGSPSGANANTDLSNITEAGKEVIRKNAGSGLPIGSLYPSFAAAEYVPEFALSCDATEYSSTQFSGLWTGYLTAATPKLLTKNYTQYQADVTATGKCAAFGVEHTISSQFTGSTITGVSVTAATWETVVSAVGSYVFSYDGSGWSLDSSAVELATYGVVIEGSAASGDTVTITYAYGGSFKVPYIPDGTFIQQALSDDEAGKAYAAGLPNISFSASLAGAICTPTGGALISTGSNSFGAGNHDTSVNGNNISFSAARSSSIYSDNSNTVQPESVALRWFVVVANAVENEAAMDWSQWASSLANKANADLSNCTKPYVTETYRNGASWYRVWSDGLIEQGGSCVSQAGSTGLVTINLLKSYSDTNYSVFLTTGNSTAPAGYYGNRYTLASYLKKDQFTVTYTAKSSAVHSYWYARGY